MTDDRSLSVIDICGMVTQGHLDQDLHYLEQALLARRMQLGPMKRKRGSSTPRLPRRKESNPTPERRPAPGGDRIPVGQVAKTPNDMDYILRNEFGGFVGQRTDKYPGYSFYMIRETKTGYWLSRTHMKRMFDNKNLAIKLANVRGAYRNQVCVINYLRRTRFLLTPENTSGEFTQITVPIDWVITEYLKGNVQ